MLSSVALFGAPPANAASIYDDYISVTEELLLQNTAQCSSFTDNDRSTNWAEFVTDDTAWGSNAASQPAYESVFLDALENGGWFVLNEELGTVGDIRIKIAYSSAGLEVDWDGTSAKVSTTDSSNMRDITIAVYPGSSCQPRVLSFHDNTSLVHVGTPGNATNQTRRVFMSSGTDLNYPSGYEGQFVVIGSAPPAVTGNVQCVNTNNIISAVHIDTQSGIDGNATLTDDGVGGKDYSYYMWEESYYSLVVMCDGEPFYGPTVDIDLYNHYEWVCTKTGGLNICAAS